VSALLLCQVPASTAVIHHVFSAWTKDVHLVSPPMSHTMPHMFLHETYLHFACVISAGEYEKALEVLHLIEGNLNDKEDPRFLHNLRYLGHSHLFELVSISI